MSPSELRRLIGTHVYIEPAPGLRVRVRVANVKTSFGRRRVQVEAIEGEGAAWLNVENVQPCYPEGTHTQGGANATR